MEQKMNKFFLFSLSLGLLFFVEGCGCSRDKSSPYDEYSQDESDKQCGTLYAPCCVRRTCEEGLRCDAETNTCLEEEPDNGLIPVQEEEGPCNPNPCLEEENSTNECKETDEGDYACVCLKGYSWDKIQKKCLEAQMIPGVGCTGLPENAEWNVVAVITQTWNGSEWVPSDIGVYNTEASTTECRFKCKENYEWDGSSCNALTRKKECEGLPEHASWNTVSEITQTWNGYSWEPSVNASHNTTSSTTQCRFKCDNGYFYDSSSRECLDPCMCNIPHSTGACNASSYYSYTCVCEENYSWDSFDKICEPNSRNVSCTGLPTNAKWNKVSSIKQTWNGTEWKPSAQGYYNETESTSECRFKCQDDFKWNTSSQACESEKKYVACERPPEAHWEPNTVDHIWQTKSGNKWIPSNVYTYSKTPSETECFFKCEEGYHWEYDSANGKNLCLSNHRTADCELPSSGISHWHWNTANQVTQDWNDSTSKWNPGNTGVYNSVPSSKECRFDCDEGYFWNGTACAEGQCGCSGAVSCSSKVCSIQHSTGVCISKSADRYICECEEDFYWWDDENGCIEKKPLNLGNICTGQKKCYNTSSTPLDDCPAESPATDFYGQDPQYAALKTCYQQHFSINNDVENQTVILDNNTGLEWQRNIPTGTYSWDGAKDYCGGLLYGGHTGWRLPTPHELMTILNHDTSAHNYPVIDTSYFPNLSGSTPFWTSKEFKNDVNKAWAVNIYYGTTNYTYMKIDKTNRVICVWGDELPPASLSTETAGEGENEAEVVVDSTTGLMWQNSVVTGKSWQNALSECENSKYGGFDDWRLPNKNELASLSNFGMYEPASEFPAMTSKELYFWSSSVFPYTASNVYILNSSYGTIGYKLKSMSISALSSYAVLCVRNND